MIFVVDGLKFDTDKMELVSDNIENFVRIPYSERWGLSPDAKLYQSKNGRFLCVYKSWVGDTLYAERWRPNQVKESLCTTGKIEDIKKCEEIFGEFEEG